MSVFSRSRANSEQSTCTVSYPGTWIARVFQRYAIPPSALPGSSESLESHPKVEIRFLGIACLEKGTSNAQAAFYEITECVVSDGAKKSKHDVWDETMAKPSTDNGAEEGLSAVSTPFSPMSELSSSSSFFEHVNTDPGFFPPLPAAEKSAAMILPPKKRRRHPIISHHVIFCLTSADHDNIAHLSPDIDYFLFPHDAVVEAMNESPPLDKVIFSFHPPESRLLVAPTATESAKRSYSTTLEEFAAVCSNSYPIPLTPRRRSTDPGIHMMRDASDDTRHQAVNMCISGASQSLYLAIKQSVSGFEAICDKMMHLMRLHNQQVASQKAENGLRRDSSMVPLSPTKVEPPSDWDSMFHDPQRQHRSVIRSETGSSSDEANGEKDMYDEQRAQEDPTEQEAKAQHSKWAGSPPSAAVPSLTSKQVPARSTSTNGSVKKCSYCGSKSTPMWRRGPQGAGTLCNACGVKWKHGKILCDSDVWTERLPVTKERRSSNKGERKRKKNPAKTEKRKAKEQSKVQSDDEMEGETETQHLGYHEEEQEETEGGAYEMMIPGTPVTRPTDNIFAVPAPRDTCTLTRSDGRHTSSIAHSVSEMHSSLGPSPSSSPSLWMQSERSRSLDLPIMKQMGLSDTAFSLSAGVDAVEAAAVLTLLKRS